MQIILHNKFKNVGKYISSVFQNFVDKLNQHIIVLIGQIILRAQRQSHRQSYLSIITQQKGQPQKIYPRSILSKNTRLLGPLSLLSPAGFLPSTITVLSFTARCHKLFSPPTIQSSKKSNNFLRKNNPKKKQQAHIFLSLSLNVYCLAKKYPTFEFQFLPGNQKKEIFHPNFMSM